jgi:hypothetical protein
MRMMRVVIFHIRLFCPPSLSDAQAGEYAVQDPASAQAEAEKEEQENTCKCSDHDARNCAAA